MTIATLPAFADAAPRDVSESSHGYYVYADVVDVSPRYGWQEISEPVLQCVEMVGPGTSMAWHDEHRRYHHDRYGRDERHHPGSAAAGLVGGLIGGIIGHQFGRGNGKTALTFAGAALGASIAQDHNRRRAEEYAYRYDAHDRYRPVEPYSYVRSGRRCTESQHTRRVRGVNGYDVSYRYQGATFHKWLNEHPGDRIRVHVAVEPVE
jgi:uncharacterized protein YcfJ